MAQQRQWSVGRTSEWSFKWALCRGRSQRPSLNTTGGEEKKNCWAHTHVGAGETVRLITIWKWEQIKETSHSGKYETWAHTGHMTLVPGTFASGDNEPACLFPTSLVLFFFSFLFFRAKQRLLWSWPTTNEKRLSTKKEKINGSILGEDKKLLGFNYFPLVALWICLQHHSIQRWGLPRAQ